MSRRSEQRAGPITRRQQVAAVKQLKGEEIAAAVAKDIRAAVSQEVETHLGRITDTMLQLIDRVVDLEQRMETTNDSDRADRPERTEAVTVQQNDQVVSGPHDEFTDSDSPNPA